MTFKSIEINLNKYSKLLEEIKENKQVKYKLNNLSLYIMEELEQNIKIMKMNFLILGVMLMNSS